MENRYPLFAGGRILKKEALWDLRDYAYKSWQLYYADYTDGVIKGCQIRVEDTNIVVGKGIIKCGDFIYLLQEEVGIPFTAENRLLILKAEFEKKTGNPDYMVYDVKFFLDDNVERKKNQIEFCRFHLRTGSVLRDTYKNFYDMNTKYDTVNLLHVTMAGRGQERLHPNVLLNFAKEMQVCSTRKAEDLAFCFHVLQNEGEVGKRVLDAYLQREQAEMKEEPIENEQYFDRLEGILNGSGNNWTNRQRQRVIFIE